MSTRMFIDRAVAQLKADQVAIKLTAAQKDDLLLYMAYRKRIKPVPEQVNAIAVEAFLAASQDAQVPLFREEAAAVMAIVCEQLWPVNEVESREWLLKAI